jgi:hypothetical protein
VYMRTVWALFLFTAIGAAQLTVPGATDTARKPAVATENPNEIAIPSGTEVPVVLKHAISTKNAREGDPVYAETNFPVVLNGRVLVPAGTYVQGKISRSERGGRVKGRAEILIHFTTLIYPSGYTVLLPGAIENVPGAEKTSIKDSEGTIRQDSQTGQKVEKAAGTAATGAVVGGLATGGWRGAGIGGAAGGAVGTAIALLSRGADVRLESGTTVQMIIQRAVPLDASRILAAVK